MKRKLLFSALALMSIMQVNSQTIVSGDITSNTTWTNDIIYELTGGFVYVTNNSTLTIEPGTIIKGNASTLIITRGSKLIADGTANRPIVFTSYQAAGFRAPGDWGGVYILGKAPINDPATERLGEGGIDPVKGLYGGTDASDNSGIIRYVRIEYAGIAYQPNNETNGLTLAAVGTGTTVDFVQVSHGGDDAFEFFGGTVNCKHLIANKTLDDMFDTDYGFTGKLQFLVGMSDSLIADVSGSNGFESDNDATGTTNGPVTKAIFSNVSIFGPKKTATTNINANYKRGAHLRRSTSTSIYNTLISGFPVGLKFESDNSLTNANSGSLQFKNNIIAGCAQNLDSAGLTAPWTVGSMMNWFTTNTNSFLANSTDLMAKDPYNYANPDFTLQLASPAVIGADFTSTVLTDVFFTPTTYRGAFDATTDWTSGWAHFDPQNADYTVPGVTGIEEKISFDKVKLYPNPASQQANLEFSLNQASSLEVTVLDLSGKEVLPVFKGNAKEGTNTLEINTNNLPSGLYYVKISTGNAVSTIKLAVSK